MLTLKSLRICKESLLEKLSVMKPKNGEMLSTIHIEYLSPYGKRHYGIRTDRYKLIHFYYDIDEWELFDLKNDPNEMNNIYDDPKYSKIKEQMHKKLSELRVKYEIQRNGPKNLDRYLGAIKNGKVWGIKKWDK